MSTSPAWQGSDGTTDIKVKVSVAKDASSSCELLKEGTLKQQWEPCKATFVFAGKDMADGNYQLVARAQLGDVRQSSRASFTVDRTAPKVRMLSQSDRMVLYNFWAGWAVLEKEARPPTFEVQSRVVSPLSRLGRWKRVAIGDKKAVQIDLRGGQTVCVRARATDHFGRTGKWSPDLCRTRYLDDRQLYGWRKSLKWEPVGIPGNTYGTGLVSRWHGASVSTKVRGLSRLRIWGRVGPVWRHARDSGRGRRAGPGVVAAARLQAGVALLGRVREAQGRTPHDRGDLAQTASTCSWTPSSCGASG